MVLTVRYRGFEVVGLLVVFLCFLAIVSRVSNSSQYRPIEHELCQSNSIPVEYSPRNLCHHFRQHSWDVHLAPKRKLTLRYRWQQVEELGFAASYRDMLQKSGGT